MKRRHGIRIFMPKRPTSPIKNRSRSSIERAQTARGTFDIVVANAGGAQSAPAEKISAELWTRTLNVNLTGAFLSVQPALAGMRAKKWGRIVFIASTAGIRATPMWRPMSPPSTAWSA